MLTTEFLFTTSIIAISAFAALGIRQAWGRIFTLDDYRTARGSTEKFILAATLLASFLGVFILFTPGKAGIWVESPLSSDTHWGHQDFVRSLDGLAPK